MSATRSDIVDLAMEIVCKPFEIPRFWPRCYALDIGWNRTAAVWGAWNLDEDKVARKQSQPFMPPRFVRVGLGYRE